MAELTQNERRLLAAGLMTGAAVGSWAIWKVRQLQNQELTPGLIDWDRVRSIATSMNRPATMTQQAREQLDGEYRRLVARSIPLVAEYTGDTLSLEFEQVYAFDRIDWIDANITAFKHMFEPIERLDPKRDRNANRAVAAVWSGINETVLSAQIGFMLGYLARRVLGQYDLALLGREPMESSGKLYFVEPNITAIERMLNVPPDQFRLWLALHESTHAFEFEAHPWLRDYMNSLLEQYFTNLTDDVEYLKRGMDAVHMFWNRARRTGLGANSWIELVMSPEQRSVFNKMQAMMSVVEGYSNHVMNAVGQDLMPDYQLIHRKFERRQQQRSPAEQIFARLTGLDLKLEQYRAGEAFIGEVTRQRGHQFARRVWDSPDSLPTLRELQRPNEWIQRIDAGRPPEEDADDAGYQRHS